MPRALSSQSSIISSAGANLVSSRQSSLQPPGEVVPIRMSRWIRDLYLMTPEKVFLTQEFAEYATSQLRSLQIKMSSDTAAEAFDLEVECRRLVTALRRRC